jgi:tRNA A64-2'-O-ribosylphosphate transferase
MGQSSIPIVVFLTDTYFRIILVDSTRSGKRIPDALSKTVPIWCAVVNRAMVILHPEITKTSLLSKWETALYTPPGGVSMQEHRQIEQRLDAWANSLAVNMILMAQYNRTSNS